jgi:ligand-binding sensor domain-containing protein
VLAPFLGARNVSAQQLPVRTYTTADGLPRDLVLRIVRDSHGFLWFCTADGLSRFNGYEFTTYGIEDGLPHPFINDLLETSRGVYWVATNGGGVARFNPSPLRSEQAQIRNLFTAYTVGELTTSKLSTQGPTGVRLSLSQGPKRPLYSPEMMNALTISAFTKLRLNSFSLPNQKS